MSATSSVSSTEMSANLDELLKQQKEALATIEDLRALLKEIPVEVKDNIDEVRATQE
jgi:hypothetical protein